MTTTFILSLVITVLSCAILFICYKAISNKITSKKAKEREKVFNEKINNIIGVAKDGQSEKDIINNSDTNKSKFDSTINILHKHSSK